MTPSKVQPHILRYIEQNHLVNNALSLVYADERLFRVFGKGIFTLDDFSRMLDSECAKAQDYLRKKNPTIAEAMADQIGFEMKLCACCRMATK